MMHIHDIFNTRQNSLATYQRIRECIKTWIRSELSLCNKSSNKQRVNVACKHSEVDLLKMCGTFRYEQLRLFVHIHYETIYTSLILSYQRTDKKKQCNNTNKRQ